MDGYLSSDVTWRGRFWLPIQQDQEQPGNPTPALSPA